jgi:hypothetical protein
VTLPEYLSANNTYYVDPRTGTAIKMVKSMVDTLQNPTTGATAVVLLKGTLTTTPQSIAAAASKASWSDTESSLLQTIIPLIGLLLGIVLVVSGVLLLLSEYREEYEYYEDDEALAAQA